MFKVKVVRDQGTELVRFEGLPEELQRMAIQFTAEERWSNFQEVLECSVALHAAITVESSNERQSIMRASTLNLEE